MATFRSITPLLPAGADLAQALAFYTRHLGFAVEWQGGDMAGVRRGAVALNLVRNTNGTWAENASASIGVADLDALYAEYRDLPARVGPLEVKPWGRREFHTVLPSGVCLQFFEEPGAPRPPAP
jgi:catechol 2,3-dioxygenase-like lactoylglutathione lyase family enzyme